MKILLFILVGLYVVGLAFGFFMGAGLVWDWPLKQLGVQIFKRSLPLR